LGETLRVHDIGQLPGFKRPAFLLVPHQNGGEGPRPINLTFDLKMDFEEQNGRVHYDPIDANYRVYWQGRLMRPTFSTRLAALGYLGALRNGLRKPDFAEQLPSEATKLSSN